MLFALCPLPQTQSLNQTSKMNKAEIIIYKAPDRTDFHIEVRIEDETVWLTQNQMAELFKASKQNISLHISNIFKEGELDETSTVKKYLTNEIIYG